MGEGGADGAAGKDGEMQQANDKGVALCVRMFCRCAGGSHEAKLGQAAKLLQHYCFTILHDVVLDACRKG